MLASVLDAWVTRLECPKGAKDESRGPTRSRGPEGLYTSRNNNDYKKIPCSSLEWREGTFATVARTRGVGCLWAEIHLVQVCNFRSKFLLGFFFRYDLDGHTEKDDSKAPLWMNKKKAKHLFELPATKCRSLSCLGCLCLIIMIVIIIILSD